MFDINSFVPFYFSATMGINLLCGVFLIAPGIKNTPPLYKALIIGCLTAVVYQYATWQYHDSQTLDAALYWLEFQTTIVVTSLPLLYFVYITWSKVVVSRYWLGFFIVTSLVFLFIHLSSEFTLRFSSNVSLVRYTIFTGEELSRIAGIEGIKIHAFKTFAVIMLIHMMYVVTLLLKRKKYLVASLLSITLAVQIAVALMSSMVYKGDLNFVLLGGIPFTIINLLACISISRSREYKTKVVHKQVSKRQNLESVLSSLAKGVSSSSSDNFYIQMMLELEKICGASIVYIALYSNKNNEEMIHTKAVVSNGEVLKNFQYRLEDIPQELISFEHTVFVKKNLVKRFPHIDLFRRSKAQAMISMPMLNDDGKIEGSIVLFFSNPMEDDLTRTQILDVFTSRCAAEVRRNRLEKQLHKMAYYDYQTQLPNLTKMHELIKESYEYNLLHKTQSVLIVVDLNKFTEINRQYGFENAEIAIQKLGERLMAYSSDEIVIARSGGDEFAILLRDTNGHSEGLAHIHWDAINRLISKPIDVGTRQINLSSCAGAVIYPKQVSKPIEVVRCAETALGQAKRDKTSVLRMFDESILEEIDRKEKLERLLDLAIDNNQELSAVYQPKVDPKGKLIGAEALARWHNKELGFISPVEFIAIAEDAGLIDKFGYWMVNTVCNQINIWREEGFEIPSRIAINFSALQLMKSDFVLNLVKTVKSHKIDPAQIEIELTESGLLTNIEDCISKLNSLRDVGFTIALDDFGTGYSSLAYLKDLPLDVLKIDRSFVNDLNANNTNELARSIIDIGHNMSLAIVAEGVEELIQVTTLQEMGCQIFQGYYFARPMKPDDFLKWANSTTETQTTKKVSALIN